MKNFYIQLANDLQYETEEIRTLVCELIDDFFNGKLKKDILYRNDICVVLECDNCHCDKIIDILVKHGMLFETPSGFYLGEVIKQTGR